MKKIPLTIIIIFVSFLCNAQIESAAKKEASKNNKVKYSEFIVEASKLYKAKEYKESAAKYKSAFGELSGKAYPNDRYNAACSYALAENSIDAFYHLFRLANDSKYSNLEHITVDSDLKYLHKKKQWDELISIVKTNKETKEKDLDQNLVTQLNRIYDEDQKYRKQIDNIKEKFGHDSDEMNAHWELINKKDAENLLEVEKILDNRGWLGENIVGGKGNITLFLVIQHANMKTQLKYLPMMREAVKKGNANASNLALLEDRVALREGKRQIYGSQIHIDSKTGEHYVAPLIHPKSVDKRRAEVGLGKLADYLSHWNLVWNVEKHIERTAKIEAEQKKE